MNKRIMIQALSLLCAIGSMATVPETRVMQQDNIQTSQPKTSSLIFKERVKNAEAVSKQNLPLKEESSHPTHPVKIKITRASLSRGVDIGYFDVSGYNQVWDFEEDDETGVLTVELPEETMDIVVAFSNMYINWEVGYFVNRGVSFYFIEDVEVNENTPELKADANECVMLPLSFVMADGDPLILGTQHWNGTDMEPETGGNCLEGSCDFTFNNSKYNAHGNQYVCSGVPTYYDGFGLDADTDNPLTYWIPQCNKVSDRWAFAFKINTFTEDIKGGYIAASVNPSAEPVSVVAADYDKLEWNFPDTEFQGIEYNLGIAFGDSGEILESVSMFRTSSPIDMYTAVVNKATGIENLSLIEQIKCAYRIDDSEPDWPEYYGILSPYSNTNETARYFHPATYWFTAKPFTDDMKYNEYLPEYTWGNEYANYTQGDLDMKFGDSTPFLVTNLWRMEDHDTEGITGYLFEDNIIDLAGALRTDWDKLESEVYFNGELVKDKETDFSDFQYSWNPTEKGLGKMKYVVSDTPDFKIDGMQPVNLTEVFCDQTIADWETPTLTSLLFKNGEGKVTNRIADRKNSVLEMFAGGTKWNQYWEYNPWADRYFSRGRMTITYDVTPVIEYAPTGSENWNTLDYTENDAERSEAIGNHYLVDLGKITTGSPTGWYDLRITLTTPSGNTQVQTLSPAFNIAEMSGIEEIATDTKNDEAVRYYDLRGVETADPVPGEVVIEVGPNGTRKIRF